MFAGKKKAKFRPLTNQNDVGTWMEKNSVFSANMKLIDGAVPSNSPMDTKILRS